ncbi:MAG: YgiQ family radical SAM protein [Bacteroidales bacterium]|nr:YgiQ family radical SAM protein [Bacteroidales bacterium]
MSTQHLNINHWLPTTKKEVESRGWDDLDVILFSGDAYVDHPSFGHAVIGRVLEAEGLRVAIVPQPNWQDDLRDFSKLGRPRLFFGVTAGCMDSMVDHYTANKRLRSDDAYTPGNKAGFRPDYATTVYSKILKRLFPDVPVVIGGIEASMRRFSHYDYWSDTVMPSILVDSQADLLIYGMGEKGVRELVAKLKNGGTFDEIKRTIPQTAFLSKDVEYDDAVVLPSHELCCLPLPPQYCVKSEQRRHCEGDSPKQSSEKQCSGLFRYARNDENTAFSHKPPKGRNYFARAFRVVEELSNVVHSRVIVQRVGDGAVVVNPPYGAMTTAELDAVHALPFTRMPHPKYRSRGDIPAYNMIRHSINIHRGCFGGCSFCTISMHQGKAIVSRSKASILQEVEQVRAMPDFKGTITDLGGPSANMYGMKGKNLSVCAKCNKPSCLYPKVCPNLDCNHSALIDLYRTVREMVPHVFIGSGIRYDLFMNMPKEKAKEYRHNDYFEELFLHHTGGRLKVAPEHVSGEVLRLVRKPPFALFEALKQQFDALNRKHGKRFQLIPYFIASLPACRLQDMDLLMQKTKKLGYRLEQVQGFTPTPMTLASTIYYSGYDPYSEKPVYCAKTKEERAEQQRRFFWYKREM